MDFDNYPCLPPIPASFIELAVPYSEAKLSELLKLSTEDPNLYLARGNFYLSQGSFQKAAEDYESILKLDKDNIAGHLNLAISKLQIGNSGAALEILTKASYLETTIEREKDHLAYHLALSRARNNDFKSALTALSRISKPSGLSKGLEGALLYKVHKSDKAIKLLEAANREEVLHGVPELLIAIRATNLESAFKTDNLADLALKLRDTHNEFGDRFFGSKSISSNLEKLSQKIEASGELEALVKELHLDFHKVNTDDIGVDYHASALKILFFLGLIPEFYIDYEALDITLERWQNALVERGEHPYAHFMIALVHMYKGEFEVALDRFQVCSDKLLPKKLRSLRLNEIESLIRNITRPVHITGTDSIAADEAAWREAGFSDDFTIRLWKKFNFSPEEASPWFKQAIHPKLAEECSRLRLHPDKVQPFSEQGLSNAREIRTWISAEIEPKVAASWSETFVGSVSDAIQYLNLGVKEPGEANKWSKLFSIPSTSTPWLLANYSPELTEESLAKGLTRPEGSRETKPD